jgi:hypothetical protein
MTRSRVTPARLRYLPSMAARGWGVAAAALAVVAGLTGYAVSAAAGTGAGGTGGIVRVTGTPPGPSTALSGSLPASGPHLPPSSTVTLITGDRVRLDLTPTGDQAVTPVAPAAGGATTGSSTFVRFTWAGDQ